MSVPVSLCGTTRIDVVPAEHYVEELWVALDETLGNSGCGVGSDLLEGQGGTLNPVTLQAQGAPAPRDPSHSVPPPPPPPESLPDIIKNSIHALSPRIVAVHGPTGTGKSTVFPLAVALWTDMTKGLKSGLTVCAQPRRILARQLCERVRENRKLKELDKTVGYMIARESLRDSSSKLLYCTEAVVALMMISRLSSSRTAQRKEDITTLIVDEAHNRSAQSNYVLILTLAAMQKSSRLRLALMSATGDHQLVEERIPHSQRLIMKGAMRCVRRYFLSQPMERSDNMLTMMAQIMISKHNERARRPLIDHIWHRDGFVNPSNKITVFLSGVAEIHQLCEIFRRALDFGWTWGFIPLLFHGQSSEECVETVFADPTVLAEKYLLGKNPDIYDKENKRMHEAPLQVQELWTPCRENRW